MVGFSGGTLFSGFGRRVGAQAIKLSGSIAGVAGTVEVEGSGAMEGRDGVVEGGDGGAVEGAVETDNSPAHAGELSGQWSGLPSPATVERLQ
jgi:hypothetical protein